MRLRNVLAATVFLAVAALPHPAEAHPTGTEDAPTRLAVSAPAEPVRAAAGSRADAWIQLTNAGETPIDVRLRVVRLVPHDNGRLEVVDEADPLWTDRVELPSAVAVPPGVQAKAPLRITVGAELLPDLYLIGVLAEPVAVQPPGGGLAVRSQITAVITVEVPGPRERALKVTLDKLPYIHIGRGIGGRFQVQNVGPAAALTRGQLRVDAAATGTNRAVIRATGERMQLLPAGTGRDVTYAWRTDDWFALARPTAQITYSNGGSTLGEVMAVGRPVLVLAPEFAISLAVLFVGAGAGVVLWGRARRRATERSRHRGRVARA
jgi:hypothetical protein